MKGLLSGQPSNSARRLIIGGALLLWVEAFLMLAMPAASAGCALPIRLAVALAIGALLAGYLGLPKSPLALGDHRHDH